MYTVARAIGDDAVRDGLMARNPFATVRRPRVTPVEATFLDPHQINRLLDAAQDSRYAPLVEFLVHTGVGRRSRSRGMTSAVLEAELPSRRDGLGTIQSEVRLLSTDLAEVVEDTFEMILKYAWNVLESGPAEVEHRGLLVDADGCIQMVARSTQIMRRELDLE